MLSDSCIAILFQIQIVVHQKLSEFYLFTDETNLFYEHNILKALESNLE